MTFVDRPPREELPRALGFFAGALQLAAITLRSVVRDRPGLVLAIVLPIVFQSVFAIVFGRLGDDEVRIDVMLVDDDRTEASRRFAAELSKSSPRIKLQLSAGDLAAADEAIVLGRAAAAFRIRPGFGDAAEANAAGSIDARQRAIVDVHYDPANSFVPLLARGLLAEATTRSLAQSVPDIEPLKVTPRDSAGRPRSLATYYTAAIAAMFLCFSAMGIAGGLVEQRVGGVGERLRAARIRPRSLVASRMLVVTAIGSLQVALLLAWSIVVFGVRLTNFGQITAVALVVIASAIGAAGLAVAIAAACGSRRQQAAASTIVTLVMSALGGSMFPAYMMPDGVRALGRFTLNAWMIDGLGAALWSIPAEMSGATFLLAAVRPACVLVVIGALGGIVATMFSAQRLQSGDEGLL